LVSGCLCLLRFPINHIMHKKNTSECSTGLNWMNSLRSLTETKQSNCSVLNAIVTVFTQTTQFFAKSSQIFTIKTVNRRCSGSIRQFIWRWRDRRLQLTARFCCTVLYDNTVDVHEASKNAKNDVRLGAFIENFKQTWMTLHKTKQTHVTVLFQVNPGEVASDQSRIHITHCLHFHHHYEIVYLLSVSSTFVQSSASYANTFKSLSTTYFQVFLGLLLGWAPSTP